MAFWSRRMFLKNSRSSDRGFAGGEGSGDAAGVWALVVTPVTSSMTRSRLCKRQIDLLLLSICTSEPEFNIDYFPTTNTTNEPGFIERCGRPPAVAGGVSTYSAADKKIFLVFESKAMVRAPTWVFSGPRSS